MKIRARMRCNANDEYYGNTRRVDLSAVHSQDPADPNFTYSEATPSASLTMTITKPEVAGEFVVGKTYDVTFERVG